MAFTQPAHRKHHPLQRDNILRLLVRFVAVTEVREVTELGTQFFSLCPARMETGSPPVVVSPLPRPFLSGPGLT